MIEIEPLLLPLIRNWVSRSISPESFSWPRVFNKVVAELHRRNITRLAGRFSDVDQLESRTCDVLFLPGFARVNCLGVSLLVAQALWRLKPDCKVGIVPPIAEGEVDFSLLDKRFITFNLVEKKTFSPRFLQAAWPFLIRVKQKILTDPVLSVLWRKDWLIRFLEISRIQENMAIAESFLKKTCCRLVICLNEQLWPASVFIPAAKKLGIPTVQILHGTPTRLYWPFISDETWVWDEFTRTMFEEYGAPRSRMHITGNLEVPFWLASDDIHEYNALENDNNLRTCLFFSQWSGSRIWGVPGFDEPVDWLAEALSSQKDNWKVVVRLHPYDGPDAQAKIRKKLSFLGDKLTFSDSRIALSEDVLGADFVCTGSSTAILMAQAYNKPASLLWTPVMNYVHGQPFLGERQVVYSSEGLGRIMQSVSPSSSETSHRNVVDRSDYIAAQRILQLLG